MPRVLGALATSLLLAACASDGAGWSDAGQSHRGRALAQERCASCHTIAGGAASPNPRAPAFAGIGKRYSRAGLDRELQAINDVGHYQMPTTPLNDTERRSLAAFISHGRSVS